MEENYGIYDELMNYNDFSDEDLEDEIKYLKVEKLKSMFLYLLSVVEAVGGEALLLYTIKESVIKNRMPNASNTVFSIAIMMFALALNKYSEYDIDCTENEMEYVNEEKEKRLIKK